MYHFVCPVKYRKLVITDEIDDFLKKICLGISERYEIVFLEIGAEKDHVHFLIQSVPDYSVKKIIQTIKSITAIQIFKNFPEVKRELWGGEFWTKGYFVSTVGKHGNEEVISKYVKNQGNKIEEYKLIHKEEDRWLPFF
jgi:REP element-mobilizing transposase RayT